MPFNGISLRSPGFLGSLKKNIEENIDVDFALNIGSAANDWVRSIAIQPDGKILIVGRFTTWNGVTANRLVRLNSDGTLDTAFFNNIGTASSGEIYSIAIQSDDKIILGGVFNSWDGVSVGRVVRLNSNGTRDTAFSSNIGSGADTAILSIAIQGDGKIILGGALFSFNNNSNDKDFVRLNSNGTRDNTFNNNRGLGVDDVVWAVASQPDGKVLVGGQFRFWQDQVLTSRILRTNSNGTLDTTFANNVGTGAPTTVLSIAVQSDNKILVGGAFTSFNDIATPRIVRLNSNGTRDTAFSSNIGSGPNGTIFSITVQPDNKILVGGAFTTWNDVAANQLVRLNSDGTLDTEFLSKIGDGANDTVFSVAKQTDSKILAGGAFTSWGSASSNRVVRLKE